jgi:hypothetical protein
MQTDVDLAWEAVYDALPTSWYIGPIVYPRQNVCSVIARGPAEGRGRRGQSVRGSGDCLVAALQDLEQRLLGLADTEAQRQELVRRMRLAYVEGAESFSRFDRGRPLSACELEGVLALFDS